jgi:dolichol-phosphate mannosyltransferase
VLSIVLPTYNERDNVEPLFARIARALGPIPYELVVVDDSSDGTDALVAALARERRNIRLIHRETRSGLATAVLEGIASARGDVVCVLDADLQHPPEALPRLLHAMEESGADVAVASRYVPGGGSGGLSALRKFASRAATVLARSLLSRARVVSDPMSGFFAFRRSVVEGVALRPVGYKILLEILVRGDIRRVTEVPYSFQARGAGESKLSMKQNVEYLQHLAQLIRVRPEDLRLLTFGVVGGSGILVNSALLWFFHVRAGLATEAAGVVAILGAQTWNFLLNNRLTWRDRRSASRRVTAKRYVKYWIVTAIGGAVQIGVLKALYEGMGWPLLLANLAGIVAGAIWNFRANGQWTWKGSGSVVERRIFPADGTARPTLDAAGR